MDSATPETVVLPYLIFGGFLFAALYCGVQLVRLEGQRIHARKGVYTDLCFWMLIASIVGGRLAAILGHPPFDLLQFFHLWEGGSFYFGGMPAAVGAGLIFLYKARLSIWTTADAFAPALAVGYFFVRAGCFYSGFCHRSPAYRSAFEELSGRLPLLDALDLFLAVGSLLAFVALLKLRSLQQFRGQVFWTAVLFGGLLHCTAEGLYDQMPSMSPVAAVNGGQLIALLATLGAAAMLTWLGSHPRRSRTRPL